MTYYNKTNTCDKCREKGIETILVSGKTCREKNKDGNWTGRWLCNKCYNKEYYCNIIKHDPNRQWNLFKPLGDRRRGDQNPNSPNAKGDKFQLLTVRWRSTVSTIPVEDLNEKLDNYHSPIDHSIDSELGICQTQGRFYSPISKQWQTFSFIKEWDKIFDHEICYCASKDGKIIERIYIIPKNEIVERQGLSIVKNNSRGPGWYEKYRVNDEDIIRKVNEIWTTIYPNQKKL